jgi:hypothetical protein
MQKQRNCMIRRNFILQNLKEKQIISNSELANMYRKFIEEHEEEFEGDASNEFICADDRIKKSVKALSKKIKVRIFKKNGRIFYEIF